jgi:hypothetical protein
MAAGRVEETDRRGSAGVRERCIVFLARGRHGRRHLGQIRRFIAPRRGPGPQAARQQVGRIRFDHQPVRGDALHQRQQVLAAALDADPAGEPEGKACVQAIVQ